MSLFHKPLSHHFRSTRGGALLLVAIGLVRFFLKPVFQIPYERGTTFASVTILLLILMVWYSTRTTGNYRDVLGVAAALSIVAGLVIIVSIAIDDLGGIDTYYTDPMHGGELNPWMHMGAHAVGVVVFTVALWGIGSLILRVRGGSRASAS